MIEFSRMNNALIQKKEFSLRSLKEVVGTIISNGYADENGYLLKQIPPVGHTKDGRGFCDTMANLLNASGDIDCSAPLVTDFGPFDVTTMNFQTSKGIRYFNLSNRTNKTYYTVYADINGEKGKEKIGYDVIKYYVTLDGQVLNKKPVESPIAEEQIQKLSKILDVQR